MRMNSNFYNERHLLQTNSDVCQELRSMINSTSEANGPIIFKEFFHQKM